MFKSISIILTILIFSSTAFAELPELKVKTLEGKDFNLKQELQGKVVLIANTASLCGFTPQYKDLETLHQRYKDKGLIILGFPSNDFGSQEPGDAEEIKKVCKIKYGVTFPIMQKSAVTGENIQPFFKFLTQQGSTKLKGEVQWNFEKFIIDRNGNLAARFGSFVNPLSKKITKIIEDLLDDK